MEQEGKSKPDITVQELEVKELSDEESIDDEVESEQLSKSNYEYPISKDSAKKNLVLLP